MCGVAIFNQVRGSVALLPSYRAHSHYALLYWTIVQCMIRDEMNITHTLTAGVYTGAIYDNYGEYIIILT